MIAECPSLERCSEPFHDLETSSILDPNHNSEKISLRSVPNCDHDPSNCAITAPLCNELSILPPKTITRFSVSVLMLTVSYSLITLENGYSFSKIHFDSAILNKVCFLASWVAEIQFTCNFQPYCVQYYGHNIRRTQMDRLWNWKVLRNDAYLSFLMAFNLVSKPWLTDNFNNHT